MSQFKSSPESSSIKSRSSLQSFIFQSSQVAYHQNCDSSQLDSKSKRLGSTSMFLITGSQLWTFIFQSHPIWPPDTIHIHGGRCSHKGMMGTFLKIFGPYKPLLFQFGANLQEEKKKTAQEIKFTNIYVFFFIFYYISIYHSQAHILSLPRHMPTHTRTVVSLVPCFASSPSRLGEQMSAEEINGEEMGAHPSSYSLGDLLNLPLFR